MGGAAVSYNRRPPETIFARYYVMKDFATDIAAHGYKWSPLADSVKAAAELLKAGYRNDAIDAFYKKCGELLSATISTSTWPRTARRLPN
jgi:hypothetical protein